MSTLYFSFGFNNSKKHTGSNEINAKLTQMGGPFVDLNERLNREAFWPYLNSDA